MTWGGRRETARTLVDRRWALDVAISTRAGTLPVFDPSYGEIVAEVPRADDRAIEESVRRARLEVSRGWGRRSPAARADVLRRAAQIIESRREELALVESLDCGRPISRVLARDVPLAAATFRFHAEQAEQAEQTSTRRVAAGPDALVELEPVGVVAALTPWNLPLLLASWSLAPALAAGCAVVHKPSEHAPLSALLISEWLREAGLPDGALAVLPGEGGITGAALAAHPGVDQVDFTGSVAAGRSVAAAAGAQLTRVALELGGKNPLIVLDDAEPARAAAIAAHAAFANAGQACSAGSRLILQAGIRDDVVGRLTEIVEELRVGQALEEATQVGPLITHDHRGWVRAHLEDAVARGVEVVLGPEPASVPSGGSYQPPALVIDPPADATCLGHEVFGPLATIETVLGDEEAIALANATPFGLTAGVIGMEPERCERVGAALRAGTVWINVWHSYDPAVPFPARDDSGTGVHNGREGFMAHLRPRVTWGAASPESREIP